MFPPTVVKYLDIINHVIPRFMACGIIAMRCAFSLETAQKPFRHRIVQTITFPTRATADAMCNQPVLIIMTGTSTAAI